MCMSYMYTTGDDLYHDAAYCTTLEAKRAELVAVELSGYKAPSTSATSSRSTNVDTSDGDEVSDEGEEVVNDDGFSDTPDSLPSSSSSPLYPPVRRGVGLYLSSVAVGFNHPTQQDSFIHVRAFTNTPYCELPPVPVPSCSTDSFYDIHSNESIINVYGSDSDRSTTHIGTPPRFIKVMNKAKAGYDWNQHI